MKFWRVRASFVHARMNSSIHAVLLLVLAREDSLLDTYIWVALHWFFWLYFLLLCIGAVRLWATSVILCSFIALKTSQVFLYIRLNCIQCVHFFPFIFSPVHFMLHYFLWATLLFHSVTLGFVLLHFTAPFSNQLLLYSISFSLLCYTWLYYMQLSDLGFLSFFSTSA